MKTCSVCGKTASRIRRGMCDSDYRKNLWAKRPKRSRPTFAERLLDKVRVMENGCWEWTASRTGYGYGKIFNSETKKLVAAHRASYELFIGPIPDGYEVDHLCLNKGCINPEHLEPVTPSENIRRAMPYRVQWNTKKTHCPQNHLYDAENTRLYIDPRGYVGRNCRACDRARPNDRKKKPAA